LYSETGEYSAIVMGCAIDPILCINFACHVLFAASNRMGHWRTAMLRPFGILKKTSFLLFFLIYFVANNGMAFAADNFVAQVSQFNGSVSIKRGAKIINVEKGARLKTKDSLSTGGDGSIGIIFKDETTLSLGPNSELIIQEYVFEPDHSNFSFVVSLLKGTASYVSGLIARLSPDSARIITPSASIGVRGTKFVIEVDPK
jgi:hypothetical protein